MAQSGARWALRRPRQRGRREGLQHAATNTRCTAKPGRPRVYVCRAGPVIDVQATGRETRPSRCRNVSSGVTVPGSVRISDVAAEAGVANSTVSVVLNDVAGARVSPETRERVLATANRLGYVPNGLARGLRLKRSATIGFIGDTVATTPYAVRMVLGAQDAAMASGHLLVLMNTQGNPDLESQELTTLMQHQVDGLLYATMYHRKIILPPSFRGIPLVLVDAESADAGISSVIPDEQWGARAAVEELVTHGHRRIAFITTDDNIPATRGRLAGYKAALRLAGIDFDPSLVVPVPSTPEGAYLAAAGLLARRVRPTGLFCFRDLMAIGVYHAAFEAGLRIPDDISVVGFDNLEIVADWLIPGLTTVALPHYEMGFWAVGQLLTLTGSPPGRVRRMKLPGSLIRRGSVGPPPD